MEVNNKKLNEIEGMSEKELSEYFHNHFYSDLFSRGSKVLTLQRMSLDRLLSTRLKSYTRNRIILDVYNAYKILYQAIINNENSGYQNPKELLYHDPDQVKTLLDL